MKQVDLPHIDARIRPVLAHIPDPEIPVLSILDLGVVREAVVLEQGGTRVVMTPTYSGCPAMGAMEKSVREHLEAAGFGPVEMHTRYAPAWTTDWIPSDAMEKLRAYGIAPPVGSSASKRGLLGLDDPEVACPRCASKDTRMVSQFGSTACKALYQCNQCLEPFDYFKCL